MDKRAAYVILQFDDAAYAFWGPILDRADDKIVHPLSNGAIVGLPVKHFSVLDHQFIQLRIDFNKGKELQVWIPRNFVIAILESKSDLSAAFSFAGKTSN